LPRKTDSNSPADWLFIAESELAGVTELAAQQLSYILCRSKLAEILEKVLKAELIRRGWFLMKTHDLTKLNDELRNRDAQFADELQILVEALAEAYLPGRYPGFDLDDPDWPALGDQVRQVTTVLTKVKARISDRG
jgi:HEPN domain-containing protein